MSGVEGIEAFRRRMAAIPQEIRAAIEPTLDKAAREAVREMKALAPADEGDLRDSIRVEPGKHQLSRKVIAGNEKAPHATYLEFGTVHTAAQPFFWLTIRALERRRRSQIQRAIRAAIKKFTT